MIHLICKSEVYKIIGAAIEVHRELGPGFLEPVYQEALEIEFGLKSVPYIPQKRIQIRYKGRPLKREYVADFVCFEQVVVEIKAAGGLIDQNRSQLLNYLAATGYRVGVLINFGSQGRLEWERLVN